MKCDAHLHLYDLAVHDPECWSRLAAAGREVMISHYSPWEHAYYMDKRKEGYSFRLSLGIHPQEPLWKYAEVLEESLKEGSLQALGECGYDFFHSRRPEEEKIQDEIFLYQAELAAAHGLPLVIHLRKAVDKMFLHLKTLKKVPSVVFHSWPGPLREAQSLLKSGLNAWFSFGNPLRQGNLKARECAALLPLDRLLAETDAPWQTLKGFSFTGLDALEENYREMASLRKIPEEELEVILADNFRRAYGLGKR